MIKTSLVVAILAIIAATAGATVNVKAQSTPTAYTVYLPVIARAIYVEGLPPPLCAVLVDGTPTPVDCD